MLEDLQTWWQDLPPETHANIKDASLAVGILLGGHFIGSMVARGLRSRNFDGALRLPNSSPAGAATDHGMTPTFFAGVLVRLSIWVSGAAWLAHQHGRPELGGSLVTVLSRTWAVAALLVAALALGSLLARRLIDCLGPTHGSGGGGDAFPFRNGTAGSHAPAAAPTKSPALAGVVGAAAYFLAALLVLLVAADFFEWPLTRTAAQTLWQLAQNLLMAGAALLVGYVGACSARDLVGPDRGASPEQKAGQTAALAIMAGATVLAMSVLLARSGVMIGLLGLTFLGVAVFLARGYLPDVTAGFQLRSQKVREVWFDNAVWQVAEVRFLTTNVILNGAVQTLQNRLVLDARSKVPATEPVAR
jgi:hypothetical protein